jgi:2-oxoglutarate ferredoxin oxidoreductase subunit beta
MKRALVDCQIAPKDILLCFDIGCNGNGSDKIGGYRFHGLHGRVLPFASGASVANSRLKTIAFGGDGATLGEGINHLIGAIRNNFNMTFVLHNNMNYGLTKGQASATTKIEVHMDASPDGVTADPIHVMDFVLNLKPSFAARTFSGDIKHMTETFKQAINHKGFSFIEVFQSCPTYNKETPHEWYQQRVYDVSTIPGYSCFDLIQAKEVSQDLENRIAVGVIYKDEDKSEFLQRQMNRVGIATELVDEVSQYNPEELLSVFR